MSTDVDYYDVQDMIRNERSAISAEIREAVSQLRFELQQELRDEIASLSRVLQSRTEHLA